MDIKWGAWKAHDTKKLLIFPFSHFLSLLTPQSSQHMESHKRNSRKKKKENFTAAINCTMQMRMEAVWKIYDENSYSWTLSCAMHKVSALETNEKSSSITPDFNFPSTLFLSLFYVWIFCWPKQSKKSTTSLQCCSYKEWVRELCLHSTSYPPKAHTQWINVGYERDSIWYIFVWCVLCK